LGEEEGEIETIKINSIKEVWGLKSWLLKGGKWGRRRGITFTYDRIWGWLGGRERRREERKGDFEEIIMPHYFNEEDISKYPIKEREKREDYPLSMRGGVEAEEGLRKGAQLDQRKT